MARKDRSATIAGLVIAGLFLALIVGIVVWWRPRYGDGSVVGLAAAGEHVVLFEHLRGGARANASDRLVVVNPSTGDVRPFACSTTAPRSSACTAPKRGCSRRRRRSRPIASPGFTPVARRRQACAVPRRGHRRRALHRRRRTLPLALPRHAATDARRHRDVRARAHRRGARESAPSPSTVPPPFASFFPSGVRSAKAFLQPPNASTDARPLPRATPCGRNDSDVALAPNRAATARRDGTRRSPAAASAHTSTSAPTSASST